MAVRSVPLWVAAGSYTDIDLRSYFSMLDDAPAGGGVRAVTGGEMAVSAPGGMFVAVAAGAAWVPGTDAAGQGSYLVENKSSTSLAIGANGSGNPRIDRVVADVNDPAYTGSGSPVFTLVVVPGTPAGSPSAPATPASAISLATVAVANGAAAIVAGNITDTRVFAATSHWNSSWGVPASGKGTRTGTQQITGTGATDVNFPSGGVNPGALTITYTEVVGRRYRISAQIPVDSLLNEVGNANRIVTQIQTGASGAGTVIAAAFNNVWSDSSLPFFLKPWEIREPAASGSITLHVRITSQDGADVSLGTVSSGLTYSGLLMAEDIGPVR